MDAGASGTVLRPDSGEWQRLAEEAADLADRFVGIEVNAEELPKVNVDGIGPVAQAALHQAWEMVQLMKTQRHVLFTFQQLNLDPVSCRQLLGGLWEKCYPTDPSPGSVAPGLIQVALEAAMVGIARDMAARGKEAQETARLAAHECFKEAQGRAKRPRLCPAPEGANAPLGGTPASEAA